jgi:hypothetical protein
LRRLCARFCAAYGLVEVSLTTMASL